ncbi:MAG TPA: DUF4293 domain-containing protein [Bacteroidales bacterium]
MIQRKQSLFLLGAVVSLVALFFFPLARFIGDIDSLELYVYKLDSLVPDNVPAFPSILILILAFFVVLMLLIALVSIFMYKNRKMQMFLVKSGIVINLALIASFFFYYVNELEMAAGALASYEVGTYLLLIPFAFFILALRGIVSDEKLIRSADRLR